MADQDARSSREMAYVVLEHGPVVSYPLGAPVGQWINVKQAPNEHNESLSSTEPCKTCTVSLSYCLQSEDGPCVQVHPNTVHSFPGISKPCPSCGLQPRSDASLIWDLLSFCKDIVSVESCRILLCKPNEQCHSASWVWTLSFPNLLVQGEGRRSILKKYAQRNERLHPALQTLLTIVRSDWEFLPVFMERMIKAAPNSKKNRPMSLFPANFTLEEMYSRVNGSLALQQQQQQQQHTTSSRDDDDNNSRQFTEQDCRLGQLSHEILVDKVAPYLCAASLHALRCTCTRMHTALLSVIPGLKLRLYQHQIKSLTWMRTREAQHFQERQLFQISSTHPQAVDGDAHRAATGGLSTLLVLRESPTENIRIHQLTGNEIIPAAANEHQLPDRPVARGGLLCDDPGLGKTITVLSLILQTAGMLPSLDFESHENGEVDPDRLFQTYWNEEYIVPELRRGPLLKLLNSFVKSERIGIQFPIRRIRTSIDGDKYKKFSDFEKDVITSIEDYENETETRCHLVDSFRAIVEDFKATHFQTARKSFSNISAKPNSRVAALVSQDLRAKFLKSLKPSKGTLLVVPAVLMDHWEEQILQHIDLGYLTSRKPMIFRFGEGSELSVGNAWRLIRKNKTHAPVMFLDRAGARRLPSPKFLAQFQIVVTSNQRFVNEWKNGSFQQQLRSEDISDDLQALTATSSPMEACPLLKVYWHRMVIDEGHSMAKGKESSTIQFASWISSEKRWCMTGTPTKQKATNLNQVKALFRFLRHDFFTQRCEGDKFWKEAIAQGWKAGSMSSFFRLRALLQLLMKRHTKADIEELPPPLFRESIIPMSMTEVNTYNTLVAGVQSNILITSMEGKTSGEQDSLLHKNNARHARDALANIRRVCVGWSRVVPTLTSKAYKETMDLGEVHGLDLTPIRAYIHRAESELLSECAICSIRLSTLLLMPCCAGLICTECMNNKSSECLSCGNIFDVDDFQRFQPGFVLTWKSNLTANHIPIHSASTHGTVNQGNDAPVRPNANGHPNNEIIRNVFPPRGTSRRRKYGDGHECKYKDEYGGFREDRRCILCREEHGSCNLMNERRLCHTCGRKSETCPEKESKAAYLVKKLDTLHSLHSTRQNGRPLKVIIFSQFRKALNIVGSRILKGFGSACVGEYWGKYRRQELHKFTHDNECFCLLLTKDGSEGLDLSFVTHIFLLEEIWDDALRAQAIARAWRMGATGRVEVETLVAQNTVEETMRHSPGIEDSNPASERHTSQVDQQYSRTKSLLLSLRFILDYHTFAKPAEEEAFVTEENPKKRLPNLDWVSHLGDNIRPQPKKPRQVSFELP